MTHITNAMIDMLDIFDAPESKPMPNAMREMIEPIAEIRRRDFPPNRCEEINAYPHKSSFVQSTSIRNIGGKVMIVLTMVMHSETYGPKSGRALDRMLLL
jgi:hypothetical protein